MKLKPLKLPSGGYDCCTITGNTPIICHHSHSHHSIGPLVPFHAIQETQKGPLRELFPDGGEGFTGVVQLIVAWRTRKPLETSWKTYPDLAFFKDSPWDNRRFIHWLIWPWDFGLVSSIGWGGSLAAPSEDYFEHFGVNGKHALCTHEGSLWILERAGMKRTSVATMPLWMPESYSLGPAYLANSYSWSHVFNCVCIYIDVCVCQYVSL